MRTVNVSLKDLDATIRKDLRNVQKRVMGAIKKTARHTKNLAEREFMPVAFGELRGSGRVEDRTDGAAVVWDAPHAAAVEFGSRPHMPPLEPLIRWVKLRGMQGLSKSGGVSKAKKIGPGTTTRTHAISIASQLRGMATNGANAVDDPEKIARAIQAVIAKKGTKPHHYAAKSLPEAMEVLDAQIAAALNRDDD